MIISDKAFQITVVCVTNTMNIKLLGVTARTVRQEKKYDYLFPRDMTPKESIKFS